MPKYNFHLRDTAAEGTTPVRLIVFWDYRRLKYPTGETIAPAHWSAARQRAKARAFPEHPEFNERLDNLLATAKATFRNFVSDNGREPEVDELRAALDVAMGRTEQRVVDLLTFAAEYIEKSAGTTNAKSGKLLHPTYHGRNRIALQLLKDYAARSRMGRRVPFSAVDASFVEGFAKYLTTTRGLATNTVGKYLRALRTFVNKAADEGHELRAAVLKRGGISIPEEETETVYLGPDELTALLNLDLTARPRLDRARDLFIVGAWTGLRFGDLTRVRPEHIEGGRIRIRAGKTGKEVTIPLHPHVRFLLNKYGGTLPPAISNQKQNDYIKEAAAMVLELQRSVMVGRTVAGVRNEDAVEKWRMVSTHTARRSFATNFYRDGQPTVSIMAITGHRTEEQFRKYIRLTNEEHADILATSDLFKMAPLKAV